MMRRMFKPHPSAAWSTLVMLAAAVALCAAACGTDSPTVVPDATETPDTDDAGGSLIPDDPAAAGYVDASHGLSTIAIWADPDDLDLIHANYDDDIPITVAVQMPEGTWEEVTFELHGGHARTLPKKTYRLVFPDGQEPVLDLFGDGELGTHRRFVLNASWIDPTFMRNRLTMDMARELGGLSPRLSYRILLLNGEWHGLYAVTERIDKPWVKRQDFDKDGNLYKAENSLANFAAKADHLDGYEMEINGDNPTADLASLLDILTYTPTTYDDFEAEVAPWLNIEEFMGWQLVHTLAMNTDTYTKNYYLYHDTDAPLGHDDHQFRVVSWDADATWGIAWDGQTVDTTASAWHGTDTFSPRLFSIDTYLGSYKSMYTDALNELFTVSGLHTRVAALSSTIRTAALADLEHWERDEDFDARVETLKTVIAGRHALMSELVDAL